MRWCLALLGVALGVGCGNGVCAEPQPGTVCLLAGTGELGFNRDGLPGPETDFYLPSAVRRGPDGRVYVMDFNNQRLRTLEEDGTVSTVIGSGFHAIADTSVAAMDSPLENPIDFAFRSDGRLVFVSYHDPRVLLLTEDGRLEVIAGTGEVALRGNEGDGEDPLSAAFVQLDGIAIDGDDTIYVSDSLAHRVRRIRDGVITTVAGRGTDGYSGDGGLGPMAELHWPTALAIEPTGDLLIADTLNHAVRRLAVDGSLSTLAGDGTAGYAGDGGPASAARLSQPNGLAVSDDGTIYVADRGNFRVRRIALDGTIDTVAGTGVEGYDGDGGAAREASFGYLARLALDVDGSLLIADQSNGCARRVTLP